MLSTFLSTTTNECNQLSAQTMATNSNQQVMSPTDLEDFSSLLNENFDDVPEVKAAAKKEPSEEKEGQKGEKVTLAMSDLKAIQERLAQLERLEKDRKENEEAKRLGKTLKNVPKYISFSQLTEEVLKQAEEDAKAELKAEGKPEQIWDKIIPGKIQRFISDNTTLDQEKALLDQNFIKDDSKKVGDYVKGFNVEITGFKRVTLG